MGLLDAITYPFRMLARSMENPRVPLDPWGAAAAGAGEIGDVLASSGVRVGRDKALGVAAFWRGVNLITRTVAKLPMGVYRHTDPGREHDRGHAADRLLAVAPNEMMTPFVFKQTLTGHVICEGNGYAYIMRSAGGYPLELLPLDPRRTWPVMEGGTLCYVHELKDGTNRKLKAEDVIHLKGYGYDGLVGYNVLHKAKESLGLATATTAYGGVFFRNSARPNVLLKFPQKLSPEARKNLRESWERMHTGLDNAHRTAILEEGGDAAPLTINARDAQLLESKQFSLIDVANILNLPPSRLGANVSTSYKSLEQDNQNFLDDAIDPWLVAWEEECEAKLLKRREQEKRTHAVAFDRFPLVRADLQQRGAFYQQALTAGWISLDEVRGREGLNPMPGGLGRVYFRPLNLGVVGGDPDGPGGPGVAAGAALLDVPDVRQESDWDCGPAAVQAACGLLGVGPAARADYVEALGANEKDGTRPDAVAGFLSRLGLAVTSKAALGVEDLARFFAAGQPVLCPCRPEGTAASGHWVVIIGTGLGHVFLHDPMAGRRMLPEADWLAVWRDVDAAGVAYERYGIAVGRELLPAAPPPDKGEEKPRPAEEKPADDKPKGDDDDQQGRMRLALRASLGDALSRMVTRLGRQAERAAREPATFLRWLDSMWNENVGVLADAIRHPLEAWTVATGRERIATNDDEAVAGRLAGDVRAALLAASGETGAAGLVAAVQSCVERMAGDVWGMSVGKYLEGGS